MGYLHERSEGLVLVDLVAHVVDVRREVVLGVVVDDVADVRENEVLKDTVLQVFQKPTKEPWKTSRLTHKPLDVPLLTSHQETTHYTVPFPSHRFCLCPRLTLDLARVHPINHAATSLLPSSPSTLASVGTMLSPLADLPDPQDVGEESLLVSDDDGLLQVAAVQEVLRQNSQRAKVRRLRRQHLEHALSVGR